MEQYPMQSLNTLLTYRVIYKHNSATLQTNIDNVSGGTTYSASARLNAAFIHDGTVSNAEFKYLANVSSDIQAQLSTLQTNIDNVSGGTTYSASARLNAAFIHDGTVSNAEFKHFRWSYFCNSNTVKR